MMGDRHDGPCGWSGGARDRARAGCCSPQRDACDGRGTSETEWRRRASNMSRPTRDAEGLWPGVAETERRLGRDVLVVNHGIGRPRGSCGAGSEVGARRCASTSTGPFELARLTWRHVQARLRPALFPVDRRREGGTLRQCVHRIQAWRDRAGPPVAQDAGPFGVTSNAVLPGWVRTAMAERSAKADAERRSISVDSVGVNAPTSIRRSAYSSRARSRK